MLGSGKKLEGSVCNVPVNLLGKIEKYVNSTFVVACDMDDDMPHTISLVGDERLKLPSCSKTDFVARLFYF